jgi:hypothetical protein
MRLIHLLLPPAAMFLLLSCGGGGGGGGNHQLNPGLPAPANLHTILGPGPREFALAWDPPSTTIDGYNLEGQEGSGSFQQLNTGLIPSSYTSLQFTFTEAAPEDLTFTFRLDAVKGAQTSPYSNTTTANSGLWTPGQPYGHYDWNQSGVSITWSRNSTLSTGFRIERAPSDASGYPSGNWTPLTVTDPLASSYLDTTITMSTYYTYRVTNTKGTVSSATSSASGAIFTGLPAPTFLSASWDSSKGGVYLYWYSNGIYDTFNIERVTCDTSGQPTGTWSTVASPSGSATYYTDLGTQEFTYYLYRIAGIRGLVTSLAVSSSLMETPMAPPTGLTATSATGGVQLAWQNHSVAATQIVVRRGPGSNTNWNLDIAILSSTTTSYADPLAYLGNYCYTVVAKAGSSEAASASVTFTTPNPPDALTLTSSTRLFPDATDAALTPTGTWGLATTSPFGMLSNSDPWAPYFPGNSLRSAQNMVQVDALGHPHLVYLVLNPQNNQEALLRHAWNDGTNWQNEDMGHTQLLYGFFGAGYDFRLDSTGVPHALLDVGPYGGYISTMAYVHKVNGTWVQESMGDISPTFFLAACRLRLDEFDIPHVLFSSTASVYECSRSAQGQWSASIVATASSTTNGFVDGFWSDADNAVVLYPDWGSYPSYGMNIMVVNKVAGVWQMPSVLERSDSINAGIQVAQSPDRARVAIVWADAFGFKAIHLDGSGWHPTLLMNPASTYNQMYRVGFDGSNKVHILFKNLYPEVGYTEFKE